jgi:sec-independent protein translocase protein TatB
MAGLGGKAKGRLEVFDSIGLGEIMVLLLGALFIFGPDRLPGLARDAAGALKRLRQTVTGARGQIHEQLGPEFDHLRDVDLRSLNPKTFIRKHLLEEDAGPTIHRRSGSSGSRTSTDRVQTRRPLQVANPGATGWNHPSTPRQPDPQSRRARNMPVRYPTALIGL